MCDFYKFLIKLFLPKVFLNFNFVQYILYSSVCKEKDQSKPANLYSSVCIEMNQSKPANLYLVHGIL